MADRTPRNTPRQIIGCGLDPAQPADRSKLTALGIADPYILYLGRIDPNKGCDRLLRYFLRYSENLANPVNPANPVNLVLAGPENMPIPEHPLIRRLGFVDGATRDALLANARVLVMPSPYESLSMVLLEAWNHGTAALDGGLYYQSAMECAGALDYLLDNREAAAQLGAQGRAYVDREYRWPTVMAKIETLFAEITRQYNSARTPA